MRAGLGSSGAATNSRTVGITRGGAATRQLLLPYEALCVARTAPPHPKRRDTQLRRNNLHNIRLFFVLDFTLDASGSVNSLQ